MGIEACKLVVSDLDGTLLSKARRLDPLTIQAVQALKAKGIAFTIATGRVDTMTWHFAKQLGIDIPIISCNGALVRTPFSYEPLYAAKLPGAAVNALVSAYLATKRDFFIYSVNEVYYPEYSVNVNRFHHYNLLAASGGCPPVKLINFSTWQRGKTDICPQDTIKLYCHTADKFEVQAVKECLSAYPELHAYKCGPDACDIMRNGVNKGSGLALLMELLGLRAEEVAAFGDEENDIPMLNKVANPFLMKNADKTLAERLHAYRLAEHHNCAGVARVLNRLR